MSKTLHSIEVQPDLWGNLRVDVSWSDGERILVEQYHNVVQGEAEDVIEAILAKEAERLAGRSEEE